MFQYSYINEQATWDGKNQRYTEESVPFGDKIVLFILRDPFKIFFFSFSNFPFMIVYLFPIPH